MNAVDYYVGYVGKICKGVDIEGDDIEGNIEGQKLEIDDPNLNGKGKKEDFQKIESIQTSSKLKRILAEIDLSKSYLNKSGTNNDPKDGTENKVAPKT